MFINQYFLIQECLLIPLWLNSISMLERESSRLAGKTQNPNDQKYFSRKLERGRLS
jgi:hypothetical protein